jgi:RNA polymerase sigma factor (sigma-70 family)
MDMKSVVVAAQGGDRRALDELIAAYLPLVYNVVGRALAGHADVDDVVQDTMVRMIRSLPGLREPAKFRSWLFTIALRQVRNRFAERQAATERGAAADFDAVADPGSDFADLTILRLGLSGQRRQIVEATRWLDDDDRQLLSLWWLEAAGEIDRGELVEALDLPAAHVAVRVQRVRAQLDAARSVVGALQARPGCPELMLLTMGWHGQPSPLWRKRIARHTRNCAACHPAWDELIPPERLLTNLALVPVPVLLPAALAARTLPGGTGATALTSTTNGGAVQGVPWLGQSALAKAVVAVVAGVTVVAGGVGIGYLDRGEPAAPVAAASLPAAAPPQASAASSPAAPAAAYGSTVDAVDPAPPKARTPAPLPKRPEGTLAVVASQDPAKTGGNYHPMVHRGDFVTLRGQGYFTVTYQIVFTERAGGMIMPSWTGLSGRLFHVASGGGHRMDDVQPGQPADHTFMGNPEQGVIVLPAGAQQMWVKEHFYLDGEVTLRQNEHGADYNLFPTVSTWQQITDDITTPPSKGPIRYGLTRDTGTDGAPVPQYLTRETPADPATVPQASDVRQR